MSKETLYEDGMAINVKLQQSMSENYALKKHIETLYEDGMAIAENYAKYEREIAELKKHIETIYELIAGDDAVNRYKSEEMIDYIKVLNEQIAQWEDETHESFIPTDE